MSSTVKLDWFTHMKSCRLLWSWAWTANLGSSCRKGRDRLRVAKIECNFAFSIDILWFGARLFYFVKDSLDCVFIRTLKGKGQPPVSIFRCDSRTDSEKIRDIRRKSIVHRYGNLSIASKWSTVPRIAWPSIHQGKSYRIWDRHWNNLTKAELPNVILRQVKLKSVVEFAFGAKPNR